MKTRNPIYFIITLLICIVLYSCRTAKLDPCDCRLPKNLEKIIDEITVFDEFNIRDSSKIVNIVHFEYNENNYISISTSPLSDKKLVDCFCFHNDILILYTKLEKETEALFYSDCNKIPENYRIYGITENLPEYYDPLLEKFYLLKNDDFIEIPYESIDLTKIYIKKGLIKAPPPSPIE